THAIFEKGWIPRWINEKTLIGDFEGIQLKLIACVVGKYVRVGGWDIARGEPKPMYKAVPAGSVYYFRVLNGKSIEEVKKAFHLKNISDV
ncbi:MAG: type III-B CRISPR module-associated Cmr3 family protein, partial [Candidatus Hydrothermales bacterium]